MILIVILAAAIWWGGNAIGLSRRLRIGLLALIYVAILINLALMPESARILNGSAGEWLVLGGAALLALGYLRGLAWVRKRTRDPQPAPDLAGPFNRQELERYARHIVLREVGGAGQKRLKDARVLIIGAGGLGAPVLQYLAASGVGTLGIIDDDLVENSNLQRQVIHRTDMIGQPKVASAAQAMQALNPDIAIKTYQRRFCADIADELLQDYDLVLDGTDNFDTRFAANSAAVRARKPLISGALAQWEGQVSVFDPAAGGPCYRCVFPKAPADGLAPSCAEAGVISPLPGVIGSMMALETVKVITGAGTTLRGRMLIYDGLYGDTRVITLKKRADCPDCGGGTGKVEPLG
ncbi:HesA/MoeB/ThiF family protein [Aliiroseovarius sp. PTFE2010]|uniref:HesA/MoeB/ThiF family protein n=1 Tax=Aliiroseovarius sp. PTFE2010 TaxID=3417190 RepID=UPI003CE9DE3C